MGRSFGIEDGLRPMVEAALQDVVVVIAQLAAKHPRFVGLGGAVGVENVHFDALIEDLFVIRREEI